jgi:hypothetical protein
VGLLLLKLFFSLVLLPVKLALFFVKGLLTLVVGIPLLLLLGVLFAAALPLVLILVVLPLCLLGGLVYAAVS